MIEKTINKRYKQLTYDGKKYLLDMDSNKITWFLPFLVWFLPIKAYKNIELDVLKEKENKKGNGLIILIASVLSTILIRVTANGFGDLTVFSAYKRISIILLISLMVSVFLIRFFWRYLGNNNIQKINEIYLIKVDIYTGVLGKIKYVYRIFLLI